MCIFYVGHIMNLTRNLLLLGTICVLAASSCSKKADSPASPFVTVQDGHFVRNGQPYKYIGTNFWYGPILASEGRGGDYDRLCRELDTLMALGLTNLRVLAGADADFTLYEDDGVSYGYERGECSRIRFHWDQDAYKLHVSEPEGSYPGMPEHRRFRVRIIDPDHPFAFDPDCEGDYVIDY